MSAKRIVRQKTKIAAPRTTTFSMLPEELTIIDEPGSVFYDPDSPMPEDIPEHEIEAAYDEGHLETIKVTTRADLSDKPIVFDGRTGVRRLALANALRIRDGLPPHRLTVKHRDVDDARIARIMAITRSHHRRASPAEEGRRIRELMDHSAYDLESAARVLGLTKGQGRARLKALDDPPQNGHAPKERKPKALGAVRIVFEQEDESLWACVEQIADEEAMKPMEWLARVARKAIEDAVQERKAAP